MKQQNIAGATSDLKISFADRELRISDMRPDKKNCDPITRETLT